MTATSSDIKRNICDIKEAILLIGGAGTRLYPLTKHTPKPLLPFCNSTILEEQLRPFIVYGVTDFYLCMAAAHIRHWIEWAKRFSKENGVSTYFSPEKTPLNTGGPVRLALELMDADLGENVFVMNCDIISNFSVEEMVATHLKEADTAVTILTTKVEDTSRYGTIHSDPDGTITAFLEKQEENVGDEINAGVYIMRKSVIRNCIELNKNVSIERETFPKIIKELYKLKKFCLKGYWNDLGLPQDYLRAQKHFLNNKSLSINENHSNKITNVVVFKDAKIGKDLVMENSSIWAGATIGDGVTVKNSIIGKGCVVVEDCINCVIYDNEKRVIEF